ncbi:ABC transporter permease [Lachnoclostridium phytofermentans]|uniref:ABC-2 type transporter n=1 Tax=Lachnoclostridium phytofermentans (strain ATCC 700394 / DSM 18823 / ISDg) TaxID=357809 RepID=A9KPU4_LACP7|nr:ABC transporter permease [Lachnoclostridium phytofermentans]ABX41843.1 ABC-2 type transporter [Lachnoclostridium phytofermentans ISDg]
MNSHIIKKELRESLYESKGLWMIVASTCILSGLCLITVFSKEGSVLAQSDILQYAIKAAMFVTLIVSIVLGATCFVTEREGNTLESLLLTPISKLNLTMAKYIGVLIIGTVLFGVSIPYLIAIGAGSGLTVSALLITFGAGGILLLAFTAVSVALSILMESSKASLLTSMLILLILAFPAFIQSLFKLSPVGLFFIQIDPVVCCLKMMTAILIDKTSIFSLAGYMIPLVVFAALAIALLVHTSKRVSLKGGKTI